MQGPSANEEDVHRGVPTPVKTGEPLANVGTSAPPAAGRFYFYRVATAILAAVLIVLATTLVLNNGSLPWPRSTSTGNPLLIYVDGINRSITYEGKWKGYVGPTVNDSCPYCPVGAQAGGALRIPLVTWAIPTNISLWIYTNVSGPFLVQVPGCGPAPCTFPWVKVWSYETYVNAGAVSSLTLFATFKLPNSSGAGLNIIELNATFCPSPTCPPPPP